MSQQASITRPVEWFDTVLHTLIAEDPSKVEGFNGVLAFEITGEAGGSWRVTIQDGQVSVAEGKDDGSSTHQIKMKAENFVKMINGELSGPVAFMTGKLKFKGDLTEAIKLRKLLFS